MVLRALQAGAGVALALSGALMTAASWQRWGGVCTWDRDDPGCLARQDHRYDFVVPTTPWEPVGAAAELAGWSLLVLALAFLVLPWALSGRRRGGRARVATGVASVVAALSLGAMGIATLLSGLAGELVEPIGGGPTLILYLVVPPSVLVWWAATSRDWTRAASCLLLLVATPLFAGFTYAIGPYDAQPWWEAISGLLASVAGLCLLWVATRQGLASAPAYEVATTSPSASASAS